MGSGSYPVWRYESASSTPYGYRAMVSSFVYPDGNTRVTLDLNISASADIHSFFNKEFYGRPVMPTGKHLLEVKFDEFLPDHIAHAAQTNSLKRTNYSKYYLCRKFGGLV